MHLLKTNCKTGSFSLHIIQMSSSEKAANNGNSVCTLNKASNIGDNVCTLKGSDKWS